MQLPPMPPVQLPGLFAPQLTLVLSDLDVLDPCLSKPSTAFFMLSSLWGCLFWTIIRAVADTRPNAGDMARINQCDAESAFAV